MWKRFFIRIAFTWLTPRYLHWRKQLDFEEKESIDFLISLFEQHLRASGSQTNRMVADLLIDWRP